MQRLANSILTHLRNDSSYEASSRANVAAVKSFYPLFHGGEMENVAPFELRTNAKGGIFDFDAYETLGKAISKPEQIIEHIKSCGIVGRGGSEFPVYKKWEIVAASKAPEKWVVCNCAEGEPGTGKDHAILLNKPEAVLAGMSLCGAAVGADKGVIYLRAGYEDAEKRLRETIERAQGRLGMLFEVFVGAGCYVCGEESGILEAIEGHRGEPRLKPPYPGERGLFAAPTVINNCESFVRAIHAFSRAGVNYGKRLFTISGCVKNSGVYELEKNTSLAGLLSAAGGGKAAFALVGGGATGSLVFAEDFEQVSANTGTGAVIFYECEEEAVSACLQSLEFLAKESCGKCVPCRHGLAECVATLRTLVRGNANLEILEETVKNLKYISCCAQCGLGQSAGNVFISAYEQRPGLFTAYIKEEDPWQE